MTHPVAARHKQHRGRRNVRQKSGIMPGATHNILLLETQLRSRLQVMRAEPEAGYSTEAVVVIALLVAMAITAVGIIAAKVISTAHNISTGG